MEKFFNIAGPCNPARHYMLPATARLPEVMRLVEREQYFAIHAARQSGKTTLLKGLVRDINASGERIARYFTVESVQTYPDPHDGEAVSSVTPRRGSLFYKKMLVALNMLVGSMAFAVAPTITGVTAQQRYPWNGKVDIAYTVTGDIAAAASEMDGVISPALVVTARDRTTDTTYTATAAAVSGDTALSEGRHAIVWDMSADGIMFKSTNVVFTVGVSCLKKVQLWEDGPYWATTNIGASKPENYGYRFWWGDTIGYWHKNDDWVASNGSVSNFSFGSSNVPTYGKSIATLRSEGWIKVDDDVLTPEHDAAHVHWGGDWRMPTYRELQDLESNCDWTWTTMNGEKGYVVRGRGAYASNSIFLPSAGYGTATISAGSSSGGHYWSSVPLSNSDYSWCLDFGSKGHGPSDEHPRYRGHSVRPVQGFTK